MEKNSKKEKLDKIKTDLEIKLVKIELKKVKAQELELKKSVALKVENSKKEKKRKEKKQEKEKTNTTTQVKKDNQFDKVSVVKTTNQTKKENQLDKVSVVKTTNQTKKENQLDKVSVVKTTNQTKKDSQFKKVTVAKVLEKSNEISTPKRAASKPKKNRVKQQTITQNNKTKPSVKPSKKKKNNKKIIGFVLIFIALIFTTRYLLNLKNKNQILIQNDEELINYDSNNYYKEVDDEISDDELQDFAVYKDVPEGYVQKNDTQSPDQTNKTVRNTIAEKNSTINNTNSETNITSEKANTTNEISLLEDAQDSETEKKSQTEIAETTKKAEELKINSSEKITIDYVNIIGLQFKNKKYSLPKKARKTNAFKVRVRLNKLKKSNLITTNKTEVMLVVKNSKGKTIKIDVKEVDFSTTQKTYLTFQELLSTTVEVGKEYTFSFFANKNLIKISKHTF